MSVEQLKQQLAAIRDAQVAEANNRGANLSSDATLHDVAAWLQACKDLLPSESDSSDSPGDTITPVPNYIQLRVATCFRQEGSTQLATFDEGQVYRYQLTSDNGMYQDWSCIDEVPFEGVYKIRFVPDDSRIQFSNQTEQLVWDKIQATKIQDAGGIAYSCYIQPGLWDDVTAGTYYINISQALSPGSGSDSVESTYNVASSYSVNMLSYDELTLQQLYQGRYSITEETANVTNPYAAVYRNGNDRYMYAWDTNTGSTATETSQASGCVWCIAASAGAGYQDWIYYTMDDFGCMPQTGNWYFNLTKCGVQGQVTVFQGNDISSQ